MDGSGQRETRGLTTMQSWPISCSGVPRRDSLLLAAEFRGVTGAHRQGGGGCINRTIGTRESWPTMVEQGREYWAKPSLHSSILLPPKARGTFYDD